jgi:APA family basic amino acid/polyamine antiporter
MESPQVAQVESAPGAPRSDHALIRSVGLSSAFAIVVANMIGAGIFTTTGFQAEALGSPITIYLLWIAGGVIAFCGALAYAELGAAMPRAGGEYVYLREAYGAPFACASALVSLTAGFSAPIASALESLVRYSTYFFPALADDPALWGGLGADQAIAIGLAWLLVAVHMRGIGASMRFNDWVTVVKVAGIVAIILAAAAFGSGDAANLVRPSAVVGETSRTELFTSLGTSLVFVMFCYSGWNSASYLGAEVLDPQRNLPRAMLLGTACVTVLYLGLNAVYFYGAGVDELAGKVEVGLVASRGLFGPIGVTATTLVLCVSLLASSSAMTIAGPRVYFALGRDYAPLQFLSRTGRTTGGPSTALLLQGIVVSGMIALGRVDQLQQYAGFTLSLFATLAVAAVVVLRVRRPGMERPFRTWGYPFTPLVFIAASAWMMFWAAHGRPIECMLGVLTVAGGGLLHVVARRLDRPPRDKRPGVAGASM